MPPSGLDHFGAATRAWFNAAFAEPTAAQVGAWDAISAGHHALVVAPTGSGKTLAAFLSAIDKLMTRAKPPGTPPVCSVVYISPLKALASDVERNLNAPLVGVSNQLAAAGQRVPEVSVGLRTGDTPAAQRRKFATKPPHILITTPESFYLILTSGAREGLRGVETVIIDEVHALAGTKRGAHLAISLERLDALVAQPVQRIALSATVKPVAEVARYVRGAATRPIVQPRPFDWDDAAAQPAMTPTLEEAQLDGSATIGREVIIVQPPSEKVIDAQVVLPVEDLTDIGAQNEEDLTGDAAGAMGGASIWPHVHAAVLDQIESHTSTLVFTNARRGAERLAARINEEHHARVTGEVVDTGPLQPSEIMAQSGAAAGVEQAVALAHHGSTSRERRTEIENQLKAGLLPAVVATSSLELGIDMGAIDLVVQVGAPPSVASGLQRIGRAGHQVGAVSHGLIFPLFRGDLVPATVVAARMRDGLIESLKVPANPLDVLAQQIVATVATDKWTVDQLYDLMRGAANYEHLGRHTFEAVLDMLAGRYPSADFAELRPRLVWDRSSGELSPRPGAAHLAQVSGGTIPDRGSFPVFLAGEDPKAKAPKRVGELDEEMVYESRVGDTFTLGSSTWRVTEISPQAVYVVPAPGLPGRIPFWHGDRPGRPAELGAGIGQFMRQTHQAGPDAVDQLEASGLDRWAAQNLVEYLAEQAEAVGLLHDDQTIVVETFPDELGDRRVMIHSVWGAPTHAAWAAVLSMRLSERFGLDAHVAHNDEGIMLRLPETAEDNQLDPAELLLDPDQVTSLVTASISGTAHFAARFREAAARSLTLPRKAGKRQPLWQQRHRAQQLLQIAAHFDDFPIVHEAVRECLQDDFDVPSLEQLMRSIADRRIRLVQVDSPVASPFAKAMTFGYTAQFLYDLDAPLAERRAAALSLDPAMLAELLGSGPASDPADLLDPDVVLTFDAELAHRSAERQAVSAEGLADLLRALGPLASDQIEAACQGPWREWLDVLVTSRRVIQVRLGAVDRWAVVEDAAALRDALGVALPSGLAEVYLEPLADPLGGLIRRYARNHGPFEAHAMADEFGLGVAVAARELDAMVRLGKLTAGRLRPIEAGGGGGKDYCDPDILTRARRRSLAVLRRQVEPVTRQVLGKFALQWQRLGKLSGVDGTLQAISGLAGAALPASSIESVVLPSRVRDYQSAMLDELITAGEVAWIGQGKTTGSDGVIRLVATSTDDSVLADAEPPETELARSLLSVLRYGGAFLAEELLVKLNPPDGAAAPIDLDDLRQALWELVWAGLVSGDSFAPLRAFLAGGKTAHRTARRPRSRTMMGRVNLAVGNPLGSVSRGGARLLDQRLTGRWSLAPTPAAQSLPLTPEQQLAAVAASLLERHGILTKGAAPPDSSFAKLYPLLSAMEQAGSIRRGYFVEQLGGSQFALPPCPDLLRAAAETKGSAIMLAAADPANPYGAALPWPDPPDGGHRPGRGAGALVVLVDGDLALYLERGGKTALTFVTGQRLELAAQILAEQAKTGRLGTLKVARLNGQDALDAYGRKDQAASALVQAGFSVTPSGLTLRSDHARR
ncbi:MAG: DEAD/DEAH box helicase [Micrococcales bacterium]|nr:DEAD/DEAH box helicase [Micrococcales bacterium]